MGSTADEKAESVLCANDGTFTYFCPAHETSWTCKVLRENKTFRSATPGELPDFAWVHTVNDTERDSFLKARLRGGNGVSGAQILEDKFKFALLTQRESCKGALPSFACESLVKLSQVCSAVFRENPESNAGTWMIKDAGANCGDGLYVVTSENWRDVVTRLAPQVNSVNTPGEPSSSSTQRQQRPGSTYVLQKYIEDPELWEGSFKYHCRLYLILRADGALFIHSHALAHIANKPYTLDSSQLSDSQVHLSNVSKNHSESDLFHGCPVICLEEFFGQGRLDAVKAMFKNVFEAAHPFIEHQQSDTDFCFIGADVMFESDGTPRLLECNIPPGMGNYSTAIPPPQLQFNNNMFNSLVEQFVIRPLRGYSSSEPVNLSGQFWMKICDARPDFKTGSADQRGFNLLSWKVFQRRALKATSNRPNIVNS
mmetsp:Transcript_921/g.2150  ORF Transcript_921/g.2150 Transcript_921/m.2150 type:complete len:426 (+) Transcript_921:124-1401(+)|eukprot:CAMPEP_0171520354 /NCGR_PEP_ID=MMETSP0959-20130129/6459_1 /TAXON_ID=87120 /ORGANISM="Aurantiochytrium limacinum, Strain ATCCMYA-1381" /LENGTH=425 /DNA_ID=CAMNT_0012059993 /DNA_START=124 /DNA_END=1401 /DNA_ORIENTATION=+